jgi:monoamine oxidase
LKHKSVIIIGGGLAGLYAAHRLEQQNIPYLLLEANSRLGGRILGAQNKQNSGHYFDLGPTWVFPHHQKTQGFLKQLGIEFFEHYAKGDVLYQTAENQAPQRIRGAGELDLFKIKGGCQSLVTALHTSLKPNNILLNHEMTNIEWCNNIWEITASHKGVECTFLADELMLAMPPRIIAQHLAEKQWISDVLLSQLQNSQTWMAGQAKFAVAYATPFWREQGLSGQIFSQTGPMVEIHDASTDTNKSHGLFGFIGWPASRRNQITQQQLKEACLSQLVSCYGPQAKDFTDFYIKDWANDRFTCTASDRLESSRHPSFTISNHKQALSALQLHFIGSEFAIIDPGYLEGAIDAVDRSAYFA